MAQLDETDLVYKGPWVWSAQQRLFQTLKSDYAFPRATCRSLVNLIWDFLNEIFGYTLHEGQIVYHAASASEPPRKRISQIKSVLVHLTFHDRLEKENNAAIFSLKKAQEPRFACIAFARKKAEIRIQGQGPRIRYSFRQSTVVLEICHTPSIEAV